MPAVVEEEPPKLLFACYRLKKGDVYRIKETDVKEVCDKDDVEFSWNEKGVKGDKGDKGDTGDKGDPGPAGTFGLAGLGCGFGEVLVGFTATGILECAPASTGAPPRAPAGPFDGIWAIEEVVPGPGGPNNEPFEFTCRAGQGADQLVTVTIDRWTTKFTDLSAPRDLLTITMQGTASRGLGGGTPLGSFVLSIEAEATGPTFELRGQPVSGSASVVNSGGVRTTTLTLTGDLRLQHGQFTGNEIDVESFSLADGEAVVDGLPTLLCSGSKGDDITARLNGTRISGFLRRG